MSRLEDMIARLSIQRAVIDMAARMVASLEGPVLEIGLGKGRTYSHLRQTFPDREIFAFDKDLHALPDATPSDGYLALGDFRETLLARPNLQNRPAVLAHVDIGSDAPEVDAILARDIADPIVNLVVAEGVVLSDRALGHHRLRQFDPPKVYLPSGIEPWRYFMYRVAKP